MFGPKIILARIKSLFKRQNKYTSIQSNLTYKNISIHLEKREVLVKGSQKILPKKEFDLLYLLASKPEKVFNRNEIYLLIWGDNVVVGDRTLDVHIRKLRKKIGDAFIKTTKGVGYSFIDQD